MKVLMPVAGWIVPAWADFAIMAGAFLLVAAGALIWIVFFYKTLRRRRKHRHHQQYRPADLTLAQKGGLPPVRGDEKPPGPPSTHRP